MGRLTLSKVLMLALALCASTMSARAQQSSPEIGPLTSTLDLGALRDLPSTDNLFSLLETTQAEVISDRFSGGVNAAEPARLGAFLSSWTQTTFRVDDVDITSADRGGPLFVPPVLVWQRVHVTSGVMPADVSGPGLLIALEPLRPPGTWSASAEGSGSGEPLVATNERLAPSIARPAGWTHAAAAVGGPIVPRRVGVLVSASMTRASQFDRGRSSTASRAADSFFSHLIFTPSSADEVRTVGWRQVTRYPAFRDIPSVMDGSRRRDVSTHLQSTWQREPAVGARWRFFGAFTERAWDAPADAPGLPVIERLLDGPVSELVAPRAGRERRLSVGWRTRGVVARMLRVRHAVQAGVDASRVSSRADAAPPVTVGELVGGIPARLWTYSASAPTQRSRAELAAFVMDSVRLSDYLTLDGALRFGRVTGVARGALRGVTWNTVLPRLSLRWQLGDGSRTAVYSAYTRTADSLLLDMLAYGDPAAPVADVRRWDGSTVGPLVARAGPGAGADATLTTIDPTLRPAVTKELALGIETTPPRLPRLRLAAISRRRAHQVALFNVGVPVSSYAVSHIADPGADLLAPDDDQLLPIYNRAPETFGRDRYLVSNSNEAAATFWGLTLNVDRSTPRVFLAAGAAMGWSHAWAGNRGFASVENDAGIIGEVFTDPNAATHARGNLFSDRQYTVRISSAYRFPHDITVGTVARYQDGQAFARMVVVRDLNQGADAIRSFRNGKSRFTFTGTLDVRVQKGIALPGGRRAVLLVDGFNVLNLDKEVEEWVATGSAFRTPTAVQPPRSVHIGLRLSL